MLRTRGNEIVLLGEAEEARVSNGHIFGVLCTTVGVAAVVTAKVGQRLQILK